MSNSQPVQTRPPAIYTNIATVQSNKNEFYLDLGQTRDGKGATLVASVAMQPEVYKRLVAALTDALQKHEDRFGAIVGENRIVVPVVKVPGVN